MLSDVQTRRFWSKVALPNPDGCMLWLGRKDRHGYGKFDSGATTLAHRVSLHMSEGVAPMSRHQSAHSCRNRDCVAPAHLRWATPRENAIDRGADGTALVGDRNHKAELSPQDVLGIRRKLSEGYSQTSLGRLYGVSQQSISAIALGKSWRHL